MSNQENNQAQGNVPTLTPGLAVPRAVEPRNEVPTAERPVFRVGQEVRIACKVYASRQLRPNYTGVRVPAGERSSCTNDPGWGSQWVPEMDELLDRWGTVTEVHPLYGVKVDVSDEDFYWFSPLSLSDVEAVQEVTVPAVPELRPGQVQPQAPVLQAVPPAVPQLRPGLVVATRPAAEAQTPARPVFQVGDTVRIARKVISSSDWEDLGGECHRTTGLLVDLEWENTWTTRMDRYLGREGDVIQMGNRHGVQVIIDGDEDYGFSPLSLDLVRRAGTEADATATVSQAPAAPAVPELRPGLAQPAGGVAAQATQPATSTAPAQRREFRPGDRVIVARAVYSSQYQDVPSGALSCDRMEAAWEEGSMNRTIGRTGVVRFVDEDGDVCVGVEGIEAEFYYSALSLDPVESAAGNSDREVEAEPGAEAEPHPALAISRFSVGDRVRIARAVYHHTQSDLRPGAPVDMEGLPVWVDAMDSTVGEEGRVEEIGHRPAGHFVRVHLDSGRAWSYSPLSLVNLSRADSEETPQEQPQAASSPSNSVTNFPVGSRVRVVRKVFARGQANRIDPDAAVDRQCSCWWVDDMDRTIGWEGEVAGSQVDARGGHYVNVRFSERENWNYSPLALERIDSVQPQAAPELRPGLASNSSVASVPTPAAASSQPAWPTRLYMVLGGACGESMPTYVLGIIPALVAERSSYQGFVIGQYDDGPERYSPFLNELLKREFAGDWRNKRIGNCTWAAMSRSSAGLRVEMTYLLTESDVEDDEEESPEPFLWMSLVSMDTSSSYAITNCTNIEGLSSIVYED